MARKTLNITRRLTFLTSDKTDSYDWQRWLSCVNIFSHLSLCRDQSSAATLRTTPQRSSYMVRGRRSADLVAAVQPREVARRAGGQGSKSWPLPCPSVGREAWDRSVWACWTPRPGRRTRLRTYSSPVRNRWTLGTKENSFLRKESQN